jgi:hypothetical protein
MPEFDEEAVPPRKSENKIGLSVDSLKQLV